MVTGYARALESLDGDELLTTGEAARLIGVSRQHIVDLVDRGDLPATRVGTHRRVRRGDLPDVTDQRRSTRDQDRSRWLGIATAGAFVRDPEGARALALGYLASSRTRPNRWTSEWEKLLRGPAGQVVDALTSNTVRARELRQNSPFVGLLSEEDRERVLSAFRAERMR